MQHISIHNTHYTPLPYIIWGLIQDLKTKTEEIANIINKGRSPREYTYQTKLK